MKRDDILKLIDCADRLLYSMNYRQATLTAEMSGDIIEQATLRMWSDHDKLKEAVQAVKEALYTVERT